MQQQLDQVRRRAEELRRERARDAYDVACGRRQASDLASIYARFSDIVDLEAVEGVRATRLPAEEAEARRLQKRLLVGLVESLVERETLEIRREVERRDREMLGEGSAAPTLLSLDATLAREASPEERDKLEAAANAKLRDLTPQLAERLGIEQGIAKRLVFVDHMALRRELYDTDAIAAADAAKALLEATGDMFREVLGWLVKRATGRELADARRADVLYVLGDRFREHEDRFAEKDPIETAQFFLQNMGVDLRAGGRVSVEVDPAADGPRRAFAVALDVPNDIRLWLARPRGNESFALFFGHLGSALFWAHIDARAPFEDRWLGDRAIDRAMHEVFRHLLLDRSWLKRHLGISRPKDFIRAGMLSRLYRVRLAGARLLYEVELRRSDSVERKDERFADIHRGALGFAYPKERFLYDVRDPFASLDEVRGLLFEGLLAKHLCHYFDEDWFRNPRAGRFLRDRWAVGRRDPVEAIARDLGYEPTTPQPLIEMFSRDM